jgi:hypothetical protein
MPALLSEWGQLHRLRSGVTEVDVGEIFVLVVFCVFLDLDRAPRSPHRGSVMDQVRG